MIATVVLESLLEEVKFAGVATAEEVAAPVAIVGDC
jgi:hypothetical protein